MITINLKRDEMLLESGQKVFGDQPVCHECHVLGGLPEGLDDSGVADDHDDAGDQECDHQLVESEVDPEMEDDANGKTSHDFNLPYAVICIITVSYGDQVCAVGIVVGEHILGR